MLALALSGLPIFAVSSNVLPVRSPQRLLPGTHVALVVANWFRMLVLIVSNRERDSKMLQ